MLPLPGATMRATAGWMFDAGAPTAARAGGCARSGGVALCLCDQRREQANPHGQQSFHFSGALL